MHILIEGVAAFFVVAALLILTQKADSAFPWEVVSVAKKKKAKEKKK